MAESKTAVNYKTFWITFFVLGICFFVFAILVLFSAHNSVSYYSNAKDCINAQIEFELQMTLLLTIR